MAAIFCGSNMLYSCSISGRYYLHLVLLKFVDGCHFGHLILCDPREIKHKRRRISRGDEWWQNGVNEKDGVHNTWDL